MHQIDEVLISDETWDLRFACDLKTCKGDCCRLGDMGAPVEPEEVLRIKALLAKIVVRLPKKNASFLEMGIAEPYKGKLHLREMAPNHPCPLGFFHPETGVLFCSLHDFAQDNNIPITAVKPLWCCLFPLMVQKGKNHWIINVSFAPHCRSEANAPPILLAFSKILISLFGQNWLEKVRRRYRSEGIITH